MSGRSGRERIHGRRDAEPVDEYPEVDNYQDEGYTYPQDTGDLLDSGYQGSESEYVGYPENEYSHQSGQQYPMGEYDYGYPDYNNQGVPRGHDGADYDESSCPCGQGCTNGSGCLAYTTQPRTSKSDKCTCGGRCREGEGCRSPTAYKSSKEAHTQSDKKNRHSKHSKDDPRKKSHSGHHSKSGGKSSSSGR